MNWFKRRSSGAENADTNVLELAVQGMTCDHCAMHVKKALESVDGVASAEVPSWKGGKAFVRLAGEVAPELLEKAVSEAGYQAVVKKKN